MHSDSKTLAGTPEISENREAACRFYRDNPDVAQQDFSRRFRESGAREHSHRPQSSDIGKCSAFLGWVDPMSYLNLSRGLSTHEWIWAKPEHGNVPVYLVVSPSECISSPALSACVEGVDTQATGMEYGELQTNQIVELANSHTDSTGRLEPLGFARSVENMVVGRLAHYPVVIGEGADRLASAEKRIIELELVIKKMKQGTEKG